MHVAKKAAKKAAIKAARGPQHFKIELEIRNAVIFPLDTAFEKGMQIGDNASFVITGEDDVTIEFTSVEDFNKDGTRIPANVLPFGVQAIRAPDPSTNFNVVNSCKAMMKVTMMMNGIRFTCPWNEKGGLDGNSICTSGGDHVCH